jgi:hypothetical protein
MVDSTAATRAADETQAEMVDAISRRLFAPFADSK